MMWIILSILAALGDSLIFLSMKKMKNISYYFGGWLKYSTALPLLVIFILFTNIPPVDNIFFLAVILHSIIVFFAMSLIMKATNISDLAKSIPMLSLTPLFLIIIAFFINKELPNIYGFFGICLIVIGAYVLNIGQKGYLFGPIKSLFTQKGSYLVLIVALLFSLSASIAKLGVVHSNGPFFSFSTYLFVTVFFSPIFFYKYKKRIKEFRLNKKYIIIMGISATLMILTSTIAMQTALVSYVIALKRLSVLFSVLFGFYFFKEKGLSQNLLGTVLMLIGAIVITIFNT